MDNETQDGPATGRGMPKSPAFSPNPTKPIDPVTPDPVSPLAPSAARAGLPVTSDPVDAGERNGVFRHLVTDDTDIAGLVAYSIYKQNKLDWLNAFETAKGRNPDDDELASYIIGEGTPRRLATYRHLAEATLAGNGPEIGGAAGQGTRAAFRRGLGDKTALTTGLLATYALVAVLFLIGFLLAAHYTMTSR